MAKASKPVISNIGIKVVVDLKLQLRRHNGTLMFTWVCLLCLMIRFLCRELKKVIVFENYFKFNNYFFTTGTPTANKLDECIPFFRTLSTCTWTKTSAVAFGNAIVYAVLYWFYNSKKNECHHKGFHICSLSFQVLQCCW